PSSCLRSFLFVFIHPAPTQISPLSLHDALPISARSAPPCRSTVDIRLHLLLGKPSAAIPPNRLSGSRRALEVGPTHHHRPGDAGDRKSTRLNSSHQIISYAVFCLKKKKINYSND